MPVLPARRLGRPIALLSLALLALAPVPAVASGADLSYEVWMGSSRVMKIELSVENGGDDYSMALDALLVGPPAWFDDYRLVSKVEGAMAEQGPTPRDYRTESHFEEGKKVKWIELAFDEAGQPLMTSDPPFSPHTRPMLEAGELAGSEDPLSAILTLLHDTTAAGRCVGEAKVYDGRRRFDLAMLDRGQVLLERGLTSGFYEGPALRCAVQLTPVGGYRYDGEDKSEVSSGTVLYLAELKPGLPRIPVRIEAETGCGGVEIHLVKAELRP
jgi:hypothetical protein